MEEVSAKLNQGESLRKIIRISFLILLIPLFLFSLFSGAEQAGGGLRGIILNSPNALPWAIFIILVFLASRYPIIVGSLICLLGLGTIFLFHLWEEGSRIMLLIIPLPICLFGGMFIYSWFLDRNNKVSLKN